MHVSRTILSVVAILFLVGIYFLPKVVVENSETEDSTELSNSVPENIGFAHDRELTESEAQQIFDFKEDFKNQDNPEKSASFADSLAGIFANLKFLDSAAYYYAQAATYEPVLSRFIKAGNGHFEAFSYAVELEEQSYWGEKTREYYQKALAEDPNLHNVKTKMALTHLPVQPMQGVILLREVIENDPENDLALYNLGLLSLQSSQFDKAVQRFEKLVESHPDNLEGQFYLGVAYFESKALIKAKEQFLKVQTMDTDPEVQTTIEEYLKKLK